MMKTFTAPKNRRKCCYQSANDRLLKIAGINEAFGELLFRSSFPRAFTGNSRVKTSAESSYSQPSSDPSVDDEGIRQRVQYNEQTVLQALDSARTAYVEFTLRANVSYDGTNEPDAPIRGRAISFAARDFIFVKAKFSEDWWIGQSVREGSEIGFVPTPSKLSGLSRPRIAKSSIALAPAIEASGSGSLTATPSVSSSSKGKLSISTPPNIKGDTKTLKPTAPGTGSSNSFNEDAKLELAVEGDQVASVQTSGLASAPSMRSAKKSTGTFFRKTEMQAPYEVVPNMRPVMLIGPSLKGYDVTDMMQKAVFSRVKERLGERVQVLRVKVDLTLAKRAAQSAAAAGPSTGTQRRGFDKVARSLGVQVADVQAEIENIFQAARLMRLIVVDCDTINHPSQLAKTGLAPIAVHLKITSAKVLQRLIKTRGKDRKNMSVQITALENLNKCPPDSFDLILDDNQFESASHRLVDFLESYWRASHPPCMFAGATDPIDQLRYFDDVHRPRMEKRDRERDAFSAANREQLLITTHRDSTTRTDTDTDQDFSPAPASSEIDSSEETKRRLRIAAPEVDEEASAPASGSSSTHTQLTNVSGAASRRASAQTRYNRAPLSNEEDEQENSQHEPPSRSQCGDSDARLDTGKRNESLHVAPIMPPFEDDEEEEFARPSSPHLVTSRSQPEPARSSSIVA